MLNIKLIVLNICLSYKKILNNHHKNVTKYKIIIKTQYFYFMIHGFEVQKCFKNIII